MAGEQVQVSWRPLGWVHCTAMAGEQVRVSWRPLGLGALHCYGWRAGLYRCPGVPLDWVHCTAMHGWRTGSGVLASPWVAHFTSARRIWPVTSRIPARCSRLTSQTTHWGSSSSTRQQPRVVTTREKYNTIRFPTLTRIKCVDTLMWWIDIYHDHASNCI